MSNDDNKKPTREEVEQESVFTAENRKPKELVTLGGTAVTTDGKITKSGYFRFLKHDLDNYEDVQLSKKQAQKIQTHIQKLSTGSTAMAPMFCGGAHCPFATRCPLVQTKYDDDPEVRGDPIHGKAPIGRQCIIEVQLMKQWIVNYFEEYDVDPTNWTEVGYVNELAEIEILLMRLNMNIAKVEHSELVIDQMVGVGQDGTPIIQKALSPFMEQKERLQSRRSKIIKLMVGDRQEKYKKEAALKIKLDSDPSSKMAEMRQKMETLTRQLDTMSSLKAEKATSPGSPSSVPGKLTPQDLIDAEDDEADANTSK